MHNKSKVLDSLFVNLAAYVQKIADGGEAMILSSDFSITNQPAFQQKSAISVYNALIEGFGDRTEAGIVELLAKAKNKIRNNSKG